EHADILNYLGYLHGELNEPQVAEPLHRQVLEVRRRVRGEDHPAVALSLTNLGLTYFNRGDYGKAEPLFRQAAEVRKRTLGAAHPDYAESLVTLAALHRERKDYEQALELLKQALIATAKRLGEKVEVEQHPAGARIINQIGLVCFKKEDYATAEDAFRA